VGVPRSIVAIGDSFTAGFGYFDNGNEMSADEFEACVDLEAGPIVRNNPCSSNSTLRSTKGPLTYAPDFGFANQVSWAAQAATALGFDAAKATTGYANLAVSGSTAREWAEGSIKDSAGVPLLDAAIGRSPDVVLMTLGGNPTLARVLIEEADRCAAFDTTPISPDLYECFAKMVSEDGTRPALTTVYERLLTETKARIVVVLYPIVMPLISGYSPEALATAAQALNDTVTAAIATAVEGRADATRLVSVQPTFATGVLPGNYTAEATCFGEAKTRGVDGPSNQSADTQDALFPSRFETIGYCTGTPWVISTDLGVHPNRAGYAHFSERAVTALTR
jgi:lysophospholipase L1-like esterase